MEKKQAEILAPAGSWASMKAAVAAGADAVYMGGTRFGARAYADNPDEKGLLEAIDYVHLHGRRLYMTVNTLFKESELKELAEYMTPYYNQGLDGVIVQDLGALRIMKENFPGLELHASTQMTITSVYGARMLKDFGCSRVVTSREMSLDEIRRVREEVDVEIESFVHGPVLLLLRPVPYEQPDWREKRKPRALCPALPSALPGIRRTAWPGEASCHEPGE